MAKASPTAARPSAHRFTTSGLDQLHPAIVLPPFRRLVVSRRLRVSVALRRQLIRHYPILCRERLLHRVGPRLAQLQVGVGLSDIIGVPLNLDLEVRVLLQRRGDLLESRR